MAVKHTYVVYRHLGESLDRRGVFYSREEAETFARSIKVAGEEIVIERTDEWGHVYTYTI